MLGAAAIWLGLVQAGAAVPGVPDRPETAVLPTEALAPVIGAPGEFWLKGMRLRAPIVAEQPIRVAAAIVRTDGPDAAPMPMIVIGKVSPGAGLPADPARLGWCDVTRAARMYACFQDLDGDERLESVRQARALHAGEPLTIVLAGKAAPLPAVIPYRRATDAERPGYRLVYESCGGGGVTGVPRFVQRVRGAGGGAADYACTGSAVRTSGVHGEGGTFRVDRLVVDAVPKENSAETRLVSGIPAGTLLDRIMPAEAVVDLGTRPSFEEELVAAATQYSKPAFQLAAVELVKSGEIRLGNVFMSGRLGWGYTGRIARSLTIKTLASSRAIEAGEQVYGVPMTESGGRILPNSAGRRALTWCAPRRLARGWEAVCLPVIAGTSHTILEAQRPAFFVTGMAFSEKTVQAIGLPEVTEGPIDFGSIEVQYRVAKCAAGEARIELISYDGTMPAGSEMFIVKAAAASPMRFALGGGVVEIANGGKDTCRINVIEPPKPGGNAMPGRTSQGADEVRLL
jgi:hypothetical protein